MIVEELFEKGGVIMVILAALSVYVVAVIFYKLYQFWRMQAFCTGFINEVMDSVEDKRLNEAMRIASTQRNPIARVLETSLACISNGKLSEDKKVRRIEASGNKEIRAFQSHLRGLEMVANIAPLLGLLGTVIGMVKAFAGLNQIGARIDPSVLAGGIWEALLTTVAGLVVAIPALAAHYIIEGRIESIKATTKDAVAGILAKGAVAS